MHVHEIVFFEVDSPFVRCVHVSVFSFLPCAIRVSPCESVIIFADGSLHYFRSVIVCAQRFAGASGGSFDYPMLVSKLIVGSWV